MATLAQDIYNIKNVAYKANPSVNANLREAQIQHWLITYREMVISQMFMKNPERSDTLLMQDLGCIQLSHIDKIECPCLDITWDCTVAKASVPKPVTIDSSPRISITYMDGTSKLLLTDPNIIQESMYARFTGRKDKAFITNGREEGMVDLYVLTENDDLEYLRGRGILSDPTKVTYRHLDNGSCVETCYDIDDDEFPMNGSIRANVYKMIFETEFRLTMGMVDDVLNNNQEDSSALQVKQLLEQLELYGKRSSGATPSTGQGRIGGSGARKRG